ncbi:uncharacterized protein LOC122954391 isoform X2 [Acropora millepora]|uniref:uncharacterized protein LOC122954391 isoform X2 n=1 Tax=Acropora millepora TaxID=45264 RepID=UPI001CF318A3|nr:uncharacterized protein LOC122954391 isoform X2 [Acropora millepora]
MPYWRKWARNCPLREKLEQRFAGLSSRILLLLIRIVPRFTTLLQIFIVVVLALLPIQSTSLSSSLPTSSSTAFLLDVRFVAVRIHSEGRNLQGKNCYCIAYVETTTVQIPRLNKCCSCSRWCRLEWSNFTYSVPTWVMVHWLLCQCLSLDVNLTWSLMKLKNWAATPLQKEYLMIWGLEVTLICAWIISKEGTEYLRPYNVANDKGVRQGRYSYKRGTTAVVTKDIKPIVVDMTETTGEAMEM